MGMNVIRAPSVDDVPAIMRVAERYRERDPIDGRVDCDGTGRLSWRVRELLREHYKDWERRPYRYEFTRRHRTDWDLLMSKPERLLWSSIIQLGMSRKLLPQFPIDRFFADFADPWARLVIEVDGAAYHQDKEKDWQRQTLIEGSGWKVFRINAVDAINEETAEEFVSRVYKRHEKLEFGFEYIRRDLEEYE